MVASQSPSPRKHARRRSRRRGIWGPLRRTDRALRIELLEPRQVLDAAGPLLISEFLADNATGLVDEDGEHQDWIEIFNPAPPGSPAVSLAGWSLTNDVADPGQWVLPNVSLPGQQSLVVFASNKDRANPAGTLHTNFRLGDEGEYLALVMPNGTVSHGFAPAYPPQREDVSYGPGGARRRGRSAGRPVRLRADSHPHRQSRDHLAAAGLQRRRLAAGDGGVGYQTDPAATIDYTALIGTDIESVMLGKNPAVFTRRISSWPTRRRTPR